MVLDQAGGGRNTCNTSNTAKADQMQLGEISMLGDPILQIGISDFFVAGAVVFRIHIRKDCTSAGAVDKRVRHHRLLHQHVVSGLLVGRGMFRAAEYAQLQNTNC